MMTLLIATAAAVAAPATPAHPTDVHSQHQGQPRDKKDCCKDGCKDCCDDMNKHEGHPAEHGDHAG